MVTWTNFSEGSLLACRWTQTCSSNHCV